MTYCSSLKIRISETTRKFRSRYYSMKVIREIKNKFAIPRKAKGFSVVLSSQFSKSDKYICASRKLIIILFIFLSHLL